MNQPHNLAQLKRAATLGAGVRITNRLHDHLTRDTWVTKESTVDLITFAFDPTRGPVEQVHMEFGKAGLWEFDVHGAHRIDHLVECDEVPGVPWLTIEFLPDEATPRCDGGTGLCADGLEWNANRMIPAQLRWIDDKGYAYCATHGRLRNGYRPCRELTAYEVHRIRQGLTVPSFDNPTMYPQLQEA